MEKCIAVCDNWCNNPEIGFINGINACQKVLLGFPPSDFELMVDEIGTQVTNALEGLNVDVEGIARWVEEKADELKNMEDRHERELQDLKDEIAQEGEDLAN